MILADPGSTGATPPEERPQRRFGLWRILVASLLTAGLLGFLVQVASPSRIWEILRSVRWLPLLAGLLVYLSNNLVRAERFRALGAESGLASLYAVASLHAFLLRVLPFRSGDLSYAPLLRAVGGGGLSRGLAGIIVMRIVDMTVLLLALVVFFIGGFLPGAAPGVQTVIMIGFAAGGGLLLYLYLDKVGKAGLAVLGFVLERMTLRRWKGINEKLDRMSEELTAIRNSPPLQRLKLFVLTLLFWIHIVFTYYFALWGLGTRLPIIGILTFGVFGVAGSMVPLSAVGTFGFQEAGFAMGLMAAGVKSAEAVALGLTVSIVTLLLSFTSALPFGSWLLLSRRSIKGT